MPENRKLSMTCQRCGTELEFDPGEMGSHEGVDISSTWECPSCGWEPGVDDKDVTELVHFGNPDDELLPITRCVCGRAWRPWDFAIGIYPRWAKACPDCGRRLYFTNKLKVWETSPRPNTGAAETNADSSQETE